MSSFTLSICSGVMTLVALTMIVALNDPWLIVPGAAIAGVLGGGLYMEIAAHVDRRRRRRQETKQT